MHVFIVSTQVFAIHQYHLNLIAQNNSSWMVSLKTCHLVIYTLHPSVTKASLMPRSSLDHSASKHIHCPMHCFCVNEMLQQLHSFLSWFSKTSTVIIIIASSNTTIMFKYCNDYNVNWYALFSFDTRTCMNTHTHKILLLTQSCTLFLKHQYMPICCFISITWLKLLCKLYIVIYI